MQKSKYIIWAHFILFSKVLRCMTGALRAAFQLSLIFKYVNMLIKCSLYTNYLRVYV